MTETEPPGDDWTFEPLRDGNSAGIFPEAEATNVCRVSALGSLIADVDRRRLLEPLTQLGFSEGAVFGTAGIGRGNLSDWFVGPESLDSATQSRLELWSSLNQEPNPARAVQFMFTVLGSPLERESAAAAASLIRFLPDFIQPPWVLWPDQLWDAWPETSGPLGRGRRPDLATDLNDLLGDEDRDRRTILWDPQAWSEFSQNLYDATREPTTRVYIAWLLVTARLRLAASSPDPVTRSFALAARLGQEPFTQAQVPAATRTLTPHGALVVSTMVHGTFGWKGDWWRPSGSFHQHVIQSLRPNLYSRGARYSWSGAYSAQQRQIAAGDLMDWTSEVAPHGLQTLFAHSYGGEVSALAVLGGVSVHELVLMSCPGTGFVNQAVATGIRVVDVRLPFDPVLAIANTSQYVVPGPDFHEVVLDWSLDHSATHREDVWVAQSVAERGNL